MDFTFVILGGVPVLVVLFFVFKKYRIPIAIALGLLLLYIWNALNSIIW